MSKKQRHTFNLFLFFSCSIILSPIFGYSLSLQEQLAQADSLFAMKKYTESFEVYEHILNEQKQATPQMLMKMAFIKEGLGDHSEALLYLNKYYLKTSDKKAQEKMTEIAKTNDLYGYQSNDITFFTGIINKYYSAIAWSTLGVCLLLLIVGTLKKFLQKKSATPYIVPTIILLAGYFTLINFSLDEQKAIIIDNHAYLMSGPSSGSDLIDVVQKGHQVTVLDDQQDVWTKIDWLGAPAYIRKTKIK